jgi:alginate O-acetyltransferase complex protein AlgI
MLFVEPQFLIFFAIVLGVYWSLRQNEHRKSLLLLASYFFYGSWDWRFAVMLFVISFADYLFAWGLDRTDDPRRRKWLVTASVAMNLSVLFYFKYCNFFIDSAIALANKFGAHLSEPTLNIILPVGVSFFTFQSLSYTIDVYRKELKAVQKPKDYLLFSAFFPQLVAGPIVRPHYFLPQLTEARHVSTDQVKAMVLLFMIGFIKKACIADNISPYVDLVFATPVGYTNLSGLIAVWLYATQIYCDFSGYTDMAIAVAGLMGYKLVINFDAPYLAVSLQDFWRRWHISLSTWIRDYIYISLGGRNANRWITYRNLVYTMLAGGLWHGAAWTFVAWGGLHGLGQVVQQEFRRWVPITPRQEPWRTLASWFLTLNFVCICWVFFRASDFSTAFHIIGQYCFLGNGGPNTVPTWLLGLPPVLLTWQLLTRRIALPNLITALPLNAYVAVLGISVAGAASMLPLGYRPFIYFQF